MEFKKVGAWVPLTPQKPWSKGEDVGRDYSFPNSVEAADGNGGLCSGTVENLASSCGVEINFCVETDESKCMEKEGKKVDGFEDEGKNLHSAKNLLGSLASPSISTPFASEKQNTRKRENDGVDMNKKPKQRVKRHRPKIKMDRWEARKNPKAQTPRQSTPKILKPLTPKNVNSRGRSSGKPSNKNGFKSTSDIVKEKKIYESSTYVAVTCKRSLTFECEAFDSCDNVVGSCSMPLDYELKHLNEYSVPGLQSTSENVGKPQNILHSDFSTESRETNEKFAKRFSHKYQRRMKNAGMSSLKTNIGINIVVEKCIDSSLTIDKKELMFASPNEMQIEGGFHQNDHHGKSKTSCLQFYRRLFRANQCRQNSRKSGPNFPKICKKPRNKRDKATAMLTIWSIIGEGGGAKRKMIYDRREQINKRNCFQIDWKNVCKGVRSPRKSKYQRFLHGCHDIESEKALLKMIMPTEKQTNAALADPQSFKCVMGLSPVAKCRRKRSSRFIHQIFRNTLYENYIFEEPPIYPSEDLGCASYGSNIYESQILEVQLSESENYQPWEKNISRFYSDEIVTCGMDMMRGHQLKETLMTQTLEVPLTGCVNSINCSMNAPRFFLNDVEAHSSERLQPDNKCLDVVLYEDVNYAPQLKYAPVTHKKLMDLISKVECLNIYDGCQQLVVQDQKYHAETLVKIGFPKMRKAIPKVALDSETLRMSKLLDNGGKDSEDMEGDKKEWWAKEREVFCGRANSFIARMHLMQGDRRFSKWKGSVVDSVVGVYLTQNVTDFLSSSVFINLAAKYPVKSRNKVAEDVKFACGQISDGRYKRANTQTVNNECTDFKGGTNIDGSFSCASLALDIEGSLLDMDLKKHNKVGTGESFTAFRKSLEWEEINFLQQFYGAENDLLLSNVNMDLKPSPATKSMHVAVCNGPDLKVYPQGISRDGEMECVENKSGTIGSRELSGGHITTHHNVNKKSTPKKNSSKSEKKNKTRTEWEELRRSCCSHNERGKNYDTINAVDWEAVMNASVEEVAETIAERGMNNVIAARIKDFLERVFKDHGNIDLEWLRDIVPDDAKDFLSSIVGLGPKSVDCVRLLALHQHAFPVDTNVGRVLVRLGWVQLAPLPEELKLHLLDMYPLQEKIHTYLFPRLCTLPVETLYELHYQLITFGKVFCTKRKPNCRACPLRGECKHYASLVASSRLALPWKDNSFVGSNMPESQQPHSLLLTSPLHSLNDIRVSDETDYNQSEINVLDSTCETQVCKPIIEVPESPEPESHEPTELADIEDYFIVSDDEIPVIRIDKEEWKKTLQNVIETEYKFPEGNIENALTALTKEAAPAQPSKLRFRSKNKTLHQVFELPDFHPLLEEFEERVSDDPCPYLLAVWPDGDISGSLQKHSSGGGSQEFGMHNEITINSSCRTTIGETRKGTILIPCRTAMRGIFPLNGTYFQVNEVFADYETSKNPIDVPKAWICNLQKRSLHCGVSVTTIFKESSTEEIQYCFWKGYICVRSFHKRTRVTRRLLPIFHIPYSAASKMRAAAS